jgi:sugar/nucleoside kinase (ribokinase family)
LLSIIIIIIIDYLGSKGIRTKLLSCVGKDSVGQGLLEDLNSHRVDASGIAVIDNIQTASYTAIHDNTGDLALAVANMNIFEKINDEYISKYSNDIIRSKVILIDGNISFNALKYISQLLANNNNNNSSSNKNGNVLIFEPTSDHKCLLPFLQKPSLINVIDIIKPNLSELRVMVDACLEADIFVSNTNNDMKNRILNTKTSQDIHDIGYLGSVLLHAMEINNNDNNNNKYKHVLVSLGSRGILWITRSLNINNLDYYHHQGQHKYYYSLFPSLPLDKVRNTNGAGDSFLGGFISYLISNNMNILDSVSVESINTGLQAAKDKLLYNLQK